VSIGEVLTQLRSEFSDITISKIRFLETEGLVAPERTASGYRKFTATDIARLRYVLAQQRDNYLPLRVIKEQLDAIDRGLVPPGAGGIPKLAHLSVAERAPTAEHFRPATPTLRLSREELVNATGLRGEQLSELEQFGLISARPGGHYDDDALAIGKVVAEMARFGIEGRHLRAFRSAADREIGLFGQVVGPDVAAAQSRGEVPCRGDGSRAGRAVGFACTPRSSRSDLRDVTGSTG